MSYLTYDPATSKYPIRGFSNPNSVRSPDNPDDPFFDDIFLYLKGDGENDSTLFTDYSLSPKVVTPSGDTKISTAQSKYGASSIYFDGIDDYLTVTEVWTANSTVTVESWLYPTATFTSGWFDCAPSVSGAFRHYNGEIHRASSGGIAVSLTTNQWSHLAACINTTTGRLTVYLNGTLVDDVAVSTTYSLSEFVIGSINQGFADYTGYMDSFRVTLADRYTANFNPETDTYLSYPTVAPPSDPYINSVVLHLKGDGTNGSTAIVDESPAPKTITVVGNTNISTAQSKYGGSSILFDGSGDYLTTESSDGYTFGTEDFTIEGWLYSNATQASATGVIGNLAYANDQSCNIRFLTGNVLIFGNWNINIITLGAINNTEWTHIAISRGSGTIRSFIDGALINTVANSTNFNLVSTCKIGTTDGSSTSFNGYLDSFRITKGIARYTANFDPETDTYLSYPTVAPPSDPYINSVVLHLKGDGTNDSTNIVDSSPTPKTITSYGNAKISTVESVYGGSSMYFDGNGDYLDLGTNSIFQLGAEDFTIECWFFNSWNSTYTSSGRICGTYYFSSVNLGWSISVNTTSPANAFNFFVAGAPSIFSVPGYLDLNKWHHLAVSREGSALRMFINGVVQRTDTVSFNDTYSNNMYVGSTNDRTLTNPVGTMDLQGYIDSFRITKGIARYTANFDPETDTYLAY